MSFESNDYAKRPPDLNFPLPTLEDVGSEPRRWLSEEIQSQLNSTDILLISANDDAFLACYSHMKQVRRSYYRGLGMVDFGQFDDENDENVKVALMRRSKGACDTQTAVKNAAGVLHPKVALLIGICETMKPKKAKRGDVAISAGLANCDGFIPKVSREMARLNLYAADGWKPPLQDPNSFQVEVHREALMLTVQPEYESQVDNLKNRFPNALVIEVGGKGLYKAAYDLDMEWTIIRGVVSALANESEEENVEELWKRFASVMAVSVVHNMFKYPVVLQDWPQRG